MREILDIELEILKLKVTNLVLAAFSSSNLACFHYKGPQKVLRRIDITLPICPSVFQNYS